MSLLANATWYEIAWTLVCLVWVVAAVIGTLTAWTDFFVSRSGEAQTAMDRLGLSKRDRAGISRAAWFYIRYESSSLFGALLMFSLGVRAMLLPPGRPVLENGWALFFSLWIIAYAVLKTTISVLNRLSRRKFDRGVEEEKG